jgi:hypothetical protein
LYNLIHQNYVYFLCLCSEGKDCTLKEFDSDVEECPRTNGRGGERNRFRKRRVIRKSFLSEDSIEGPKLPIVDGKDMPSKKPTRMFSHHRNTPRKQTSSISKDVYSEEVKEDEV